MATEILTAERLRELLDYDPETGVFRWRADVRCGVGLGRIQIQAGTEAGCTARRDGYIRIRVLGTLYQAHRLAYLWMTGAFPEHQLDHKNRCRSDNRWQNLRPATDLENRQNIAARSDNKFGCRGVGYRPWRGASPWEARVKVNGKIVNRFFGSLLDAAAWVISTRRRLMPFSQEAL